MCRFLPAIKRCWLAENLYGWKFAPSIVSSGIPFLYAKCILYAARAGPASPSGRAYVAGMVQATCAGSAEESDLVHYIDHFDRWSIEKFRVDGAAARAMAQLRRVEGQQAKIIMYDALRAAMVETGSGKVNMSEEQIHARECAAAALADASTTPSVSLTDTAAPAAACAVQDTSIAEDDDEVVEDKRDLRLEKNDDERCPFVREDEEEPLDESDVTATQAASAMPEAVTGGSDQIVDGCGHQGSVSSPSIPTSVTSSSSDEGSNSLSVSSPSMSSPAATASNPFGVPFSFGKDNGARFVPPAWTVEVSKRREARDVAAVLGINDATLSRIADVCGRELALQEAKRAALFPHLD